MLRFPLKEKILLITTAGSIIGKVIKASDDFLFCDDVEYNNISLGKLYVDRSAVVAFSRLTKEKKLEDKITQTKIIHFNKILGNK